MPHKEKSGYVSVTQVIGCLDKPWKWNWYRSAVKTAGYDGWLKCDETSRIGRETGTEFHEAVEGYLINKTPVSQKFMPWQTWYEASGLKPVVIEPKDPYVCEKLKLQGTPDLIADEDGHLIVWDWKFAKAVSDDYGLQLSAYTYLAGVKDGLTEEETWKRSPHGKVCWFNKTTNVVKDVTYAPLEKYWRVFKALVPAAHYLRGIGEWA